MKLVLRKEVGGLGAPGDVVNVKPGYARNYLLPRDMAYPATGGMIERVEREKKKALELMQKEKREAEALAGKLAAASLTITVEAGEEDKLFGSVTSIDIGKALAGEGFEIDRHDIMLDEPIRELGVHNVKIKLLKDVAAEVKVWVVEK